MVVELAVLKVKESQFKIPWRVELIHAEVYSNERLDYNSELLTTSNILCNGYAKFSILSIFC